jgi:ornithine cyclodeaminase/alanine dehydrogenase-like protein (mu-crystallin family)
MDATYITGIRTAAAAVLSHKLLSRPESRLATIVGAGVQAREHLRLLSLVRDFDEIQICALEFEHAERLSRLHPKALAVRDVKSAIKRSDVVCLATHSAAPVIEPDWVQPEHMCRRSVITRRMISARARARSSSLRRDDGGLCGTTGRMSRTGGVDCARGTTLGDVVNDRRKGRATESEV